MDKSLWFENLRLCAQHNLNEYDCESLDIPWWSDYWAGLKLDVIILTAGGFIATYPTDIPHHHRSQFLQNRDFFGEYAGALKKKGIRVVARIETNWAHQDVLESRPAWFERDIEGEPVYNSETPWAYSVCMYSDYHTAQVPAIMRELSARYDVDGFFTNSWPPSGAPSICYCEHCRASAAQPLKQRFIRQQNRILKIVSLLTEVAREGRADRVYNVNIGGGIRASQSLYQLGKQASWITADHQGRTGNIPIWDVTQQGRVSYAIMKTKPVTNVVGSKSGPWRHSAKTPLELEMWLAGCVASGMVPWFVWLGGVVHDKRCLETGERFYRWIAHHRERFNNVDSITNLGVVLSQKNNALYRMPPPLQFGYGSKSTHEVREKSNPIDYLQGVYYALIRARIPFDFVHEEDLSAESLAKYSVLILPNVALLSDGQCQQIRDFATSGGSVLATFETSLYDEWGKTRDDFGLSDLFGLKKRKDAQREGGIFYCKIVRPHEAFGEFGQTTRLPGGEYRVPLEPVEDPVLLNVPPYPQGIPEMVYAHNRSELPYPEDIGEEPGLVLRESGSSRRAYFSGDIGRCIWRYGNTDLRDLFVNVTRWLLRGRWPVSIEGEGVVEHFAWKTTAGYAVHILNYTNPHMTRSDMDAVIPIGSQKIRIELPEQNRILGVDLLRSGAKIAFSQKGNIVEFVLSELLDYEVAAISCEDCLS